MQKKRKWIQLICAMLYNCNYVGFLNGKIYQGEVKGVCVPGLNCYSCPGAIASCPLGSMQSALVSSKYKFPYYVLGLLLAFGIILGRIICGFLCPFGFIQEILYKIPTPKCKKNRFTRGLSYVKYVILIIFVVMIPVVWAAPGFCKYICPAGTLEGGIPLVVMNEGLKTMIGGLYWWKIGLLVLILVSTVFVFRSFCRFLCPLGAFYSFFSKVSVVGMRIEEKKCNHCNACVHHCKLDVKKVGDRECIQCGGCMERCKQGAISFGKKQ